MFRRAMPFILPAFLSFVPDFSLAFLLQQVQPNVHYMD